MACQESNDILMVAAIDFGTTYSGYAFSTRHSFQQNKLDISANQVWNAGSKQLLSLKTPTCVLLKKNKEFVSFGYEAENAYAGIVTDREEDDYYFFQQFKMMLYTCENLSLETPIEDVRGQSLPAVDVFSASIKALRDHLHQTLRDKSVDIKNDEIKWVLTVPAIWSDEAKQFMRKSAIQAGIRDDRLVIALEPEDASIYCQCLPPENLQGCQESFTNIQRGTKYMVVDLGEEPSDPTQQLSLHEYIIWLSLANFQKSSRNIMLKGIFNVSKVLLSPKVTRAGANMTSPLCSGTVDITAHEKIDETKMKELCKATGDNCGGTSVDKEFLQVLYDIVGKNLIDTMAREDVESYLDLCRAFETTKRNVHLSQRSKVNITIPFVTIDGLCKSHHEKDFSTMLAESQYADKVTHFKDRLCFDLEFLKSLFKNTLDRVISLINKVLSNENTRDISTLLLVGGFSECRLAQEAIRKAFRGKTIISPEDPALAVLKGAVLFGHMPTFVGSRVLRRTYGRRIKPIFNSSVHNPSRLVTVDGENRCQGVFEPFMTVNTSIPVGHKVKLEYHTIERKQDKISVAIYVTEQENSPTYVDDEGCKKIGEFVVNIPNPTDERRYVLVQFTFGDTEIIAKAVERDTKARCKATLKLV